MERVNDHRFAVFGQDDAAPLATEQRAADKDLDPLDLLADRGLRETEQGRRGGEAAGLGMAS